MNYEELKSRDPKELRVLAAQYGIKTHPKHKPESIAKLIVEHITAKPSDTNAMKHPAEKPAAKVIVINTQDEVNEAIKAFTDKEGYQVKYPGDDTVIFRYKGSEESIHLSSSLRTIRMKAESVSRGARLPRAIKDTMHGGPSDLVMML